MTQSGLLHRGPSAHAEVSMPRRLGLELIPWLRSSGQVLRPRSSRISVNAPPGLARDGWATLRSSGPTRSGPSTSGSRTSSTTSTKSAAACARWKGEQADEGKRRERREAEGVEGASEASRRRDQPSATRPRETALRNMLARPVDSEIVAERDPPRRNAPCDDRERGRRKLWYVRVVWLTFHSILQGSPPASSVNQSHVEGLGLQSSRQRCEHDDVVLGSASGLDPAEIDDLLIRPSEVPDEARGFSLRLAAVSR